MRPDRGVGHYLRDIVYGALDGVITTLAVISGVSGASLEPTIGLILGLANLIGDGFSMGASNYLGLTSELFQRGIGSDVEKPWRHGVATMASFIVFGGVPLVAYLVPGHAAARFGVAIALAIVALVCLGIMRARYIGRSPWRSSLEVLTIALLAGGAAYTAGALTAHLVR